MKPREAALLSLCSCADSERYSNLELDSSIKKYGFSPADRGLYTVLVYGVIEKRISLDYYIGMLSSVPCEKIEPKIMNILRLGLYQIMYMDRIPGRAAVNESVELCKLHCHRGADGFVNAVLRSAVRRRGELVPPDENTSGAGRYLSVKYGIPEHICVMWTDMYGRDRCEKILGALDAHPYITLRTNTLRTDRDKLIQMLSGIGIESEKTRLSPVGVKLKSYEAVSDIAPLSEGLCFVQDEASQLCSLALGASENEICIDTCACPGGKSFSAAMSMKNTGRLYSLDLHANKLSLVKNGAGKLGINIIETVCHNGSKPHPELIGKADRVLCDVPCSGLGVIAKKPDLRHRASADESRLHETQYAILCAGASYLKPGGTLVYSTCTLNRSENEDIAARFLDTHRGVFKPASLGVFPEEPNATQKTIFPYEFGSDGFFISKFVRIG